MDTATYRQLLPLLKHPKPADSSGRIWSFCPSHADGSKHGNRSLSLSERYGLTCFAGCDFSDILKAFGINGRIPDSNTKETTANERYELVKVWTYQDKNGQAVAEHGRFESGNGKKEFKWRRPGHDWKEGLGGMRVEELPLYNLRLLLSRHAESGNITPAGDLIYVVEGEKAADCCVEHGLMAVSLPGGAKQRQFGHSLDPLLDLDVVLWPDNDPPGRELMQKVAEILPRARFLLLPDLPDKGDAFEYFSLGGTIEQVQERSVRQQERATLTPNGVQVVIPHMGGQVTFTMADIQIGHHKCEGDLDVAPAIPGISAEVFGCRINTLSLSQRETVRRQLDEMYGKGVGWTALLNRACQMARQAYLAAPKAVDIQEIDLDHLGQAQFRVDKFVVEGATTTIFGMGDAGKGHLVVHLSICVALGIPFLGRSTHQGNVMYIDFEDDEREWARRVIRHCFGLGVDVPSGHLAYYNGSNASLADQIETIRRECQTRHIDVVIVDSAVSADTGDPNQGDTPARLFNALQSLNLTSILLAHNNKAEDDRYPLGHIMWHNRTRVSWFVKKSESSDQDIINLGLFQRKSNRMRPQPPFAVQISFQGEDETGQIVVQASSTSNLTDLSKHFSQPAQVLMVLKATPNAKTSEIAREIGVSLNQTRSVLNRLKNDVMSTGQRDGEQTWGLRFKA